jgi:hypothetical protein
MTKRASYGIIETIGGFVMSRRENPYYNAWAENYNFIVSAI